MIEQPPEESNPISDLFDRKQSQHGDFVGGDRIVFSDLGGLSNVAIGTTDQSHQLILADFLQQPNRNQVIWLNG